MIGFFKLVMVSLNQMRLEFDIEIPANILIEQGDYPIIDLVNFSYPNILNNMKYFNFYKKDSYCVTLELVEMVNNFMLIFNLNCRQAYY